MTLIRCPECGQQISDEAESCPQCGQENHRSHQPEPEKFRRPVVDEMAAARRVIEERIKEDWVAQTLAKGNKATMNRSRLRSIACICGALLIVIADFIYMSHIKQVEFDKMINQEAANKLKNKKQLFNAAKALLANQSSIPMKDLYRIEDSLRSVTLDMEEYHEAQILLNKTTDMLEIARNNMLLEIERDRKNAQVENKSIKKRVKQEEPNNRNKGKYTHGKIIQNAHSPSSLDLKILTAAQDPTDALSCYEVGVRFGRCGALELKGRICNPNDDIAVPLRCRGKAETKRGIKAGVRAVH